MADLVSTEGRSACRQFAHPNRNEQPVCEIARGDQTRSAPIFLTEEMMISIISGAAWLGVEGDSRFAAAINANRHAHVDQEVDLVVGIEPDDALAGSRIAISGGVQGA